MERENMIKQLMRVALDYDEYFFKQWIYENIFITMYNPEDGEFEFEVI